MIICEGPDGAGKTTLVSRLIDRYDFSIGQRGTSDRKLLYTVTRSDTYRALADAVSGFDAVQVWDRLFFSEMVYAPVVDRQCAFNEIERAFVNEILTALNCPVIVCLPPFATVARNIHKADQMKGVNDNIRDIYDHYDHGVGKPDTAKLDWPPQTMWYDYTALRAVGSVANEDHPYMGFNQICSVIDDYLTERTHREADNVGVAATSSPA